MAHKLIAQPFRTYSLRPDPAEPKILWCRIDDREYPFLAGNIRFEDYRELRITEGRLARPFPLSINNNTFLLDNGWPVTFHRNGCPHQFNLAEDAAVTINGRSFVFKSVSEHSRYFDAMYDIYFYDVRLFENGAVQSATLGADARITIAGKDARLAAGSTIRFYPSGEPQQGQLVEGANVSLYEHGAYHTKHLLGPASFSVIKNKTVVARGDTEVTLHSSGALKCCTLDQETAVVCGDALLRLLPGENTEFDVFGNITKLEDLHADVHYLIGDDLVVFSQGGTLELYPDGTVLSGRVIDQHIHFYRAEVLARGYISFDASGRVRAVDLGADVVIDGISYARGQRYQNDRPGIAVGVPVEHRYVARGKTRTGKILSQEE